MEGWQLLTALVRSQLLCHSQLSQLCRAFGINLRTGKTSSNPSSRKESLPEGRSWRDWDLWVPRAELPQWHQIQQLHAEGGRVQMENKLQVFNGESNYHPQRCLRFTTFQVFQHRRGGVFPKKKNQTALQPNRRSSVLMQELGMSLQGWAEGAEWAFLTSSTRILGSAAGLELIHTGLG